MIIKKMKVFISFSEENRNKMKVLRKAINESSLLEAVVVEDKRKGPLHLSELIIEGIKESDFFLPILTKSSIYTQWVNQEIGYAWEINHIEVVPIVETQIMDDLKGFINKQIQLPFTFASSPDTKKERRNFRECYKLVISYLSSKKHSKSKPLSPEEKQDDLHKEFKFLESNNDVYDWQHWNVKNGKINDTEESYARLKYIGNKVFDLEWQESKGGRKEGDAKLIWTDITHGTMSFYSINTIDYGNRPIFYRELVHNEIKYDAIFVDATDHGTKYALMRKKTVIKKK